MKTKKYVCTVFVTGFVRVDISATSKKDAEVKAMDKDNWESVDVEDHTITPNQVESVTLCEE